MQTFVVAAPSQYAAGVLINNQHFAVGNNVVTVTLKQFLGADGVVEETDQSGVAGFVEVVDT